MIEDPLSRFYDEGTAQQAVIKNPTTGLRESTETAYKKELRANEAQRKQDVAKRIITYLMQSDLGREWLHDKLTICNIFGSPFTPEPITTAYNSGALWIGRLIEDEIKRYSIREYIVMMEEAINRQAEWDSKAADKK